MRTIPDMGSAAGRRFLEDRRSRNDWLKTRSIDPFGPTPGTSSHISRPAHELVALRESPLHWNRGAFSVSAEVPHEAFSDNNRFLSEPKTSIAIRSQPMKSASFKTRSSIGITCRQLAASALTLFLLAGLAKGQTILLSDSGSQSFALDSARHFLYAAEGSNASTKHLDVINTQTLAVVGTYSFVGSGYTSQVAASGTNVFWANQGGSQVKVISVDGSGTPTLTRNDSLSLATGVAALSTTYAASLQGTGDVMKIVQISDGSVLSTFSLGGVASSITSDPLSNLYYAKRNDPTVKVIDTSGNLVRTLSGAVAAIDSSPGHHYVYFENGSTTQVLTQLNGSDNSATGNSYDFGSGASITAVAVDNSTGNLWVSLQSQNRVVELNSSMSFLQQFTVSNPAAIAFADGYAFVHNAGTNTITAIPEPGTWALVTGLASALAVIVFRRRQPAPHGQ